MTTDAETLVEEIDKLRFAALRNVFYHNARRATLGRWDRIVNLVTLLAGAAVATEALQWGGYGDKAASLFLSGLTTFVGAVALVYRFNDAANHHSRMAEKYTELLGQIDGMVTYTAQDNAELKKAFAQIAGSELPMYRAASAVAHNEALQALYGDDAPVLKIALPVWLLRNIVPFNGKVFREAVPIGTIDTRPHLTLQN